MKAAHCDKRVKGSNIRVSRKHNCCGMTGDGYLRKLCVPSAAAGQEEDRAAGACAARKHSAAHHAPEDPE